MEVIPSMGRGHLKPHREQLRLWNALINQVHQVTVVPCGRRSGKTEIAKRYAAYVAVNPPKRKPPYDVLPLTTHPYTVIIGGPTFQQTKRIWWNHLKQMILPEVCLRVSDSELMIETIFGVNLIVTGLDKPARIEGGYADLIILDEYDDVKPGIWDNNLSPLLATTYGRALFTGTPNGASGPLAEITRKALASPEDSAVFHWTSEEILDPRFLEAEKDKLDPLSYAQEYKGKFIHFQNQIYYRFNEAGNVHKSAEYDPNRNLIITMDFNVSPGTANIIQESRHWLGPGTCILDEIWIDRGSTTDRVCQLLLKHPMVKDHKHNIYFYGDATGNSEGTGKILGSDWALVLANFKPVFGNRVFLNVDKHNPPERARVNAVNSRLQTYAGNTRLVINPRCVQTIIDFKGVLCDDEGKIDKERDPKLTHLTDGIGYYVAKEFPVTGASNVTNRSLFG
jgi:hypothetical protein